jgi:ABC-type nitrate/sulfonate/bicarbonate transport system substrate-binding protein
MPCNDPPVPKYLKDRCMDSTIFNNWQYRLLGVMGTLAISLGLLKPAIAQEYFDSYGLAAQSPALDLGAQPLGYPSGVISSVMQRDRVLRKALANAKHPLKVHPFRRGADMVALLADRRLEAGLLGDMPTILAASTSSVWVVGLVKQTSTALVALGVNQVADLAGKRIGYVEASSAHHTLLQGLISAGLRENQVKLVAMGVSDMPAALARGDIDAFTAWEPAPTIALAQNARNHVIFRGLSSDYFVIGQDFAKREPQLARHLVAGFKRTIVWMRLSKANVDQAARWAMADTEAFSGKPSALTAVQIANITRREILEVPSAPVVLMNPGAPVLKAEFEFLSRLSKLPPAAQWLNLKNALDYDGLAMVLADPVGFKLRTFDYDDVSP